MPSDPSIGFPKNRLRSLVTATNVTTGQPLCLYLGVTHDSGYPRWADLSDYALSTSFRGLDYSGLKNHRFLPFGAGSIANDGGFSTTATSTIAPVSKIYYPNANNAVLASVICDSRTLYILYALDDMPTGTHVTWPYGPQYWAEWTATHKYRAGGKHTTTHVRCDAESRLAYQIRCAKIGCHIQLQQESTRVSIT